MEMIWIVISSGLFLGWLLGLNDTVNLFGSSVSSKMLNFRKAAFIASIFIIFGAAFQGKGTASTIHSLANIRDQIPAFLIALSAALTVLFLFKLKLPVSTSQAIVGSIIGFAVFTKSTIDISIISRIILAWIMAPLLGLVLGALLYKIMKWAIKKSNIHLLTLDYYTRIGLILGISLSAFGLGANNIGNVVGVFSNFAPSVSLNFGLFSIDGLQILFVTGALAISSGIFTYSFYSSNGNSKGILSLLPEAAIVVLFSQAIVLFVFSSEWFAGLLQSIGLPLIPLVPVSSTQIVVGAVLGIGLVKGAREIETRTVAGIGIGWIAAPLGAGLFTFLLLFLIQKLFGVSLIPSNIIHSDNLPFGSSNFNNSVNMILPGLIGFFSLIVFLFIYLYSRQQKLRLKAEKDILLQQNELFHSQKLMNELELRTIAMENEALNLKLKVKRKEFTDIALNINEQRMLLEKISSEVNSIIKMDNHNERTEKLKELSLMLKQKMSFSQEKKDFYMQIEEIHKDFHLKLKSAFPNLTDLEKRLSGLLRLNLSNKEISSLMNISPKSVEVARYRLKKKMNLQKEKTLNEFINNL